MKYPADQAVDTKNNRYWINTVDQSWEAHHTECLLLGIGDVNYNYRLVQLSSM